LSELPEAILLGIVQGLTEFLPISSTGHLVLFQEAIGVSEDEFGLGFDAAMHLGTLAAVLIYFRLRLIALSLALAGSIRVRRWDASSDSRLAWFLAIATVPAAVFGALLEDSAAETFRSPEVVAVMLIVFSIPMFLAEMFPRGVRRSDGFTLRDALSIGFAQSVALIPGVSRSGMTISTGMIRGFSRTEAASVAFLLSVPIIAAAGGKQLFDLALASDATGQSWAIYAVGLLTAAVVGYVTIAMLMRFLRLNSLRIFVAYRLALGILLIAMVIP